MDDESPEEARRSSWLWRALLLTPFLALGLTLLVFPRQSERLWIRVVLAVGPKGRRVWAADKLLVHGLEGLELAFIASEDEDPDVRAKAYFYFGELGKAGRPARRRLIDAIKNDPSGRARGFACHALGRLGLVEEEVLVLLVKARELAPEPEVRRAAKWALIDMGKALKGENQERFRDLLKSAEQNLKPSVHGRSQGE